MPGGSVSGNDKIWRKFTFAAVETTKVRVLTHASADGYSRVAELEAWGGGGGAGASQGTGLRWVVADQLGTPRMVLDGTGSLAGVARHDYLPFGEELTAGVGGRATAQGYGAADNLRQQFTGYDRDDEIGLDFAVTRYYSSMQGRFTTPDDFLNDSNPVDPQSWNKYTYVRNNPLKYIDPTGEKADVKIETDEVHHTGTITITASIAIYSQGNSNLTSEQLKQARDKIEESIEDAWNGSFEKDGIKYTVKTDVTVNAYGSEGEAVKSGDQNVIGISTNQASGAEISTVDVRWFASVTSGPDTGTWKFSDVMERNQAAHEFTHISGYVDSRGRADVSFSPGYPDFQNVAKYGRATGADYRGVLGRAIVDHRAGSRDVRYVSPNGRGRIPIYSKERNRTTTRTLVCCSQ